MMSRSHLLSAPRWLWWMLLAIALLVSPLFLLQDREPSALLTLLFPASLEQTVVYDEDGHVIDTTTVQAVGNPADLALMEECAEEMTQKMQPQMEQTFQAGASEFKTQHTCR